MNGRGKIWYGLDVDDDDDNNDDGNDDNDIYSDDDLSILLDGQICVVMLPPSAFSYTTIASTLSTLDSLRVGNVM